MEGEAHANALGNHLGIWDFFFERGNSRDLAEKIFTIMQKDYNSLKFIGSEGRKNVLKKFDVDKMCQTTFTEYNKLVQSK